MKQLWILAMAGAIALTGCNNGVINLPDVNLTIPIVESVKIGPSTGVSPGIPVVGVPVDLGEFCDIIDPDAIADQIRDAVGETAAGLIEIESITLKGIVFSARRGSFATFDEFALSIKPQGGEKRPFGAISAEDGLGVGFTITTDDPIDLLDFFAATDCFSAELAITGTTPETDLEMRLDAFITVSASASVVKGLSLF